MEGVYFVVFFFCDKFAPCCMGAVLSCVFFFTQKKRKEKKKKKKRKKNWVFADSSWLRASLDTTPNP